MKECLKPITTGRHGDDKSWRLAVVIQCPADLAHRGVDTALAVDEDPLASDPFQDFLASHELSVTLN
jgi:hypothetical protein